MPILQMKNKRNDNLCTEMCMFFVTINTIIFEELAEVFAFADELVMHVDAFIVQDIGIIEAFCLRYPNTSIHASTQMNTYNLEQIKYLKEIVLKGSF